MQLSYGRVPAIIVRLPQSSRALLRIAILSFEFADAPVVRGQLGLVGAVETEQCPVSICSCLRQL